MKFYYPLLFFFILASFANAQKTGVKGKVTDSKSTEPLVGVTVSAEDNTVVVTDIHGEYLLELKAGEHIITFQYIGFATEKRKVFINDGKIKTMNIMAVVSSNMLNETVISAGKFEQKLSDVTVSIQAIKPAMIENNNTNSIETIVDKSPGVTILDHQASIRGGSGYSYGAGSRVLLLVDDLPMLSGDAGDVKWEFAPVENIEQIEVIKGAASALYGSSALNGIINIRTTQPGLIPQTKIIINDGLYMNPERKEIIWWGVNQPLFMGIQFLHSRKIKNLDFTIGGNLYFDQGYRLDDNKQRARINVNLRYKSKKVKGLSYGINANALNNKGHNYLLWLNGDSGVYRPSASYSQEINNSRMNIDPFIVYYRDSTVRHSLRGRYYQINNSNSSKQSARSYVYYAEYQFQKHFKRNLTLTTGLTGSYDYVVSDLYGDINHFATNGGVFAQFDKKIRKLTLSLGARNEIYRMDKNNDNSKPVFRTGLSYQVAKATFLRASFGQGFRYPAIAEKFISSSVGAIKLFPNDTLKPETGWSAEIGFKQGFKLGGWLGYVDVAGFWTQYHNMIEFTFGQHYPNDSIAANPGIHYFDYTGFKAYNISNAQINGYDVTVMTQGILFGFHTTILAGYTFTNPIDLDLKRDSLKTTKGDILKYRFYHSAKADVEIDYKSIGFGINIEYHSYMINIDKAFEDPIKLPDGHPLIQNGDTVFILPGLKEYREKHHTGDMIFDARVSYQITEQAKVSFIVKNLFNREYMGRPGDVQPPRNIALQLSFKF